ncbi:MAG: DegV family protein [Anaerolineales bacterium]
MMSPVRVITDSTAYIPHSLIKRYHITVVPLVLIWGDETFRDGVDIKPQAFYERLVKSDSLPSTSQPPVSSFTEQFLKSLDQGQDVIAILISSQISGTVDTAQQAKQELGKGPIEIVDSETSGMAMGLHVLEVAKAAAKGASLSECTSIAQRAKKQTDVFFAVDTLEFLHRGGRIGGAKRFLGSMLNIKPILEMRDGHIDAVEQVRTQHRATDRLIELMKEKVKEEEPIRIAVMHSNAPERAQALLERAGQVFGPDQSHLAELSPVIGTHVGPGTLALACMHGM